MTYSAQSPSVSHLIDQFVKVFGPDIVEAKLGKGLGINFHKHVSVSLRKETPNVIAELRKQFSSLSLFATEKLISDFTNQSASNTIPLEVTHDGLTAAHLSQLNELPEGPQDKPVASSPYQAILQNHIITVKPTL